MPYASIQLPVEFVADKIDPLVKQKKFGFSSRASVVIEAVKALVEKLAEKARDELHDSIKESKVALSS